MSGVDIDLNVPLDEFGNPLDLNSIPNSHPTTGNNVVLSIKSFSLDFFYFEEYARNYLLLWLLIFCYNLIRILFFSIFKGV